MKARKENNKIITYNTLPKSWNGIGNFPNAHPQTIKDNGFFDVVAPTLQEGEKQGAIYWDEENLVFTYPIEDIPLLTAEQLKNKLISEGVTVGVFHFPTITDLNNFVTQKNEVEKLGLSEMGWNDKDKNWVTITITDAQDIFLQGMQGFQLIYES